MNSSAVIAKAGCSAGIYINYSKKDTDQTRVQVRENNARRQAYGC